MTARVALPAPVLGARRLRLTAEALDGAAHLLRVVGASDDAARLTTPPPPPPKPLPVWDAAALLALHVQHAALCALAAATGASPTARGAAELAAAALLLRMAFAMREAAWLLDIFAALAEGDDVDAWDPSADAASLRLQVVLNDLRDAAAAWRDAAQRAAVAGAGVEQGAAHVAALLAMLPDHRQHALRERRDARAAVTN